MALKIRTYITKLIGIYSGLMGLDPNLVETVFMRGDIQQRKRDLIAMRATIYAKKHGRKGMSYENQQKMMEKFTKTENLKNVTFPKVKIKNESNTESPKKT